MIDSGFFRSKYFAIAAGIALLIVGVAAGAYTMGGRVFGEWEDACDAPSVAGRELATTPATQVEDDGARRVVRYAVDAGTLAAGSLDLCVSVGEIYVEPATGSQVELEFTIEGRHAAAVEGTVVGAKFTDDQGRLRIAGWEDVRGVARSAIFDSQSAQVRLVVRVPEGGAYDVDALMDVGDVRIVGLRAREMHLAADVGNVIATNVSLEGNATGTADVGDVIFSFASVQSGELTGAADVGSVEFELPRRADLGYDAEGATDVGTVEVRLGDVEVSTSEADGAGETEHQRTTGFATKPTRVNVRATADVGDIRIVSSGA